MFTGDSSWPFFVYGILFGSVLVVLKLIDAKRAMLVAGSIAIISAMLVYVLIR